jgi:hypothetical protein
MRSVRKDLEGSGSGCIGLGVGDIGVVFFSQVYSGVFYRHAGVVGEEEIVVFGTDRGFRFRGDGFCLELPAVVIDFEDMSRIREHFEGGGSGFIGLGVGDEGIILFSQIYSGVFYGDAVTGEKGQGECFGLQGSSGVFLGDPFRNHRALEVAGDFMGFFLPGENFFSEGLRLVKTTLRIDILGIDLVAFGLLFFGQLVGDVGIGFEEGFGVVGGDVVSYGGIRRDEDPFVVVGEVSGDEWSRGSGSRILRFRSLPRCEGRCRRW